MKRGAINVVGRSGLLLVAIGLFWLAVAHLPGGKPQAPSDSELVLPPAMQLVVNFGDPYLAANVEVFRGLTSDRLAEEESLGFYVRLHRSITQLNSCHEDGFYMASAFLAPGGAVGPALDILNRGARCRYWDGWATFHLGINYFFFARDSAAAALAVEDAARRAVNTKNEAFFKGVSVAFKARTFDDVASAIEYLRAERKLAKDDSLRLALDKRIGRLQGLALLRDAQRRFEQRFGRPLREPAELLRSGDLKAFPIDPLGIGYRLVDGRFELQEIGGFAPGGKP